MMPKGVSRCWANESRANGRALYQPYSNVVRAKVSIVELTYCSRKSIVRAKMSIVKLTQYLKKSVMRSTCSLTMKNTHNNFFYSLKIISK